MIERQRMKKLMIKKKDEVPVSIREARPFVKKLFEDNPNTKVTLQELREKITEHFGRFCKYEMVRMAVSECADCMWIRKSARVIDGTRVWHAVFWLEKE
jgi:hypothetical protein